MSEYSILRGLTRANIRQEPFAHIVVESCLPASLYRELSQTFPADDIILRLGKSGRGGQVKPNSRHDVGAHCILSNPDCFSKTWREFTQYHVSNEFFREFVALMEPAIRAIHPNLDERFGRPLRELRTGILDSPLEAACEIALDCHIGINTPSPRRGSVRRVHTDAPDELFAALLYFRAEDDRAAGGDLEILGWKRNSAQRFVGTEVAESDAELRHTVVTRPNTAVIFVNSIAALHAVTPRSPSLVSRRLVNIMGRLPRSIQEGFFVKRQKTDWQARARRLLQRCRIAAGRF